MSGATAAGAFVVLLWTLAVVTGPALFSAASATSTESNNSGSESEEGVCKWEDAEGEKKCKEEARRRSGDPYLPDNTGGRDYVDDDDDYAGEVRGYYGYGGESEEGPSTDEEEEESDGESEDDEDEENDRKWNRGYYGGYYGNRYVPKVKKGEAWDVWKHGGKNDIYRELDCPDYDYSKGDEMFTETSFENIHATDTWKTFNRVYNEVIAAAQEDEALAQEPTIPPKYEAHGFQFPIEIKFDPVVGRGVFAKTDIPAGSLLYLSTNNAAFHHGQMYRNFLRALPDKLACDVQIWAFVRWVSLESEENEKHMVCVDLDEGSFVNSADETDDYNMALGTDDGVFYSDGNEEQQQSLWYGCKMKFFAYRDIRAGEEIRAAYGDFAETDGWMYMGL